MLWTWTWRAASTCLSLSPRSPSPTCCKPSTTSSTIRCRWTAWPSPSGCSCLASPTAQSGQPKTAICLVRRRNSSTTWAVRTLIRSCTWPASPRTRARPESRPSTAKPLPAFCTASTFRSRAAPSPTPPSTTWRRPRPPSQSSTGTRTRCCLPLRPRCSASRPSSSLPWTPTWTARCRWTSFTRCSGSRWPPGAPASSSSRTASPRSRPRPPSRAPCRACAAS
mmetsp:Transcript_9181/g.24076  ORF Transcript_9181/g.24076 Transcript_9181/m.24076 type:complete len:223 (+) Transcript_9181:1000-1668(+)